MRMGLRSGGDGDNRAPGQTVCPLERPAGFAHAMGRPLGGTDYTEPDPGIGRHPRPAVAQAS